MLLDVLLCSASTQGRWLVVALISVNQPWLTSTCMPVFTDPRQPHTNWGLFTRLQTHANGLDRTYLNLPNKKQVFIAKVLLRFALMSTPLFRVLIVPSFCFCFVRLIGGSENKLIYRHYATLYFVFCVDSSESELGILDLIQVVFPKS